MWICRRLRCCFRDLVASNKIGLDVALEALRDGWTQRKVTVDALWHCATIDRVSNVIRPCLESVLEIGGQHQRDIAQMLELDIAQRLLAHIEVAQHAEKRAVVARA